MRVLLLVALALCPLLATAPEWPSGVVMPRVVCAADPRFSYALYLPSGYREDRAWPVLFGFSPAGRGEEPVRLFKEAAERYGWIVVGSNDSRNGPLRPALEAAGALWKDVNARFRVEARRAYGTGFSGGARMAFRLARSHPKAFAGLLSFGAFGTGDGSLQGMGHMAFYLAGGMEDFNHWELLDGWEELRSRRWMVLGDRHGGGHAWPPPNRALEALEYMEWCARRSGIAAPDPAQDETFRHALRSGAMEARGALAALAMYVDRLPEAPEAEKLMLRRLLGLPLTGLWNAADEALARRDWKALLGLSRALAALPASGRRPRP